MAKKQKRNHAQKAAPQGDAYSQLKSRRPITRVELRTVVLLFAGAIALRLVFFFINKSSNPLFYQPVLDSLFHHDWAISIISGDFWGQDVFFRAPLYPYFIAALYKISGTSIALVVFIQHLIGSLNVVLIYVLARHFFVPRVATLAGVLGVIYWPLIFFESELLIVTLAISLNLIMLITLLWAIDRGSARLFLISGLVLGLSAVTRPSILIFIPVIPVTIAVGSRISKGDGRWQRQSLLVMAGIAVIVTPVIIRNYIVGHDLVPIASQGGVNFYIGNNAESNGTQAVVPGTTADLHGTFQGAIDLAEKEVGRSLKPSEVSNHYFRKGLDFIVSQPAAAFGLTAKKFYYFWAGTERSNNKYIQFFWRNFGLGKLPLPGFWFLGPFALLGGILLWKRRRELVILYLFVATYTVGVVVFFVNARFRLPIAPVLIVFAAYALCHLFFTFRRDGAHVWKLLALFIVCGVFVNYDFVKFRGVRSLDEAIARYELGNAYLKMEQKDKALNSFELARNMQERYPTRGYAQISPTIDYNLGTLYWENGQYSKAIPALQRLQSHPNASAVWPALADSYAMTGRSSEALTLYGRILDKSPNDRAAMLGSARVYKTLRDDTRVKQLISELRSMYPNDRALLRELRELETTP